ncbi:MAG TPA: T9SS type A sorting domain-containing protein, partial [Saprospiraceae bacterium]|nr:T9SS type A sorting domain-containing protein [Saprospiraceae bacterium]
IKLGFFFVGILFIVFKTEAQDLTLGLLKSDVSLEETYTLFTPEKNTDVYLVDNCGQKINQWTFSEKPGATCYILPNGDLLRAGKDSLEIRDWQNDVLWSYSMNEHGYQQHHDIEPLPNGNILCILTDNYTRDEMIEAGRNPAITDDTFKLDRIIELQPVGVNDANLVWEWKFFDHLIQDFDASKLNYGQVENHPERIDINIPNDNTYDFTHLNAVDYNSNLDQILLSSRNLNEIIIIDHSTTTLEASGHTGGNSNKGGDLLWRWGNPQFYRQGTADDQKLFFQHDSKWVETGYLDEGKISVFNNGADGTQTYSSVHLIQPELSNGEYLMANNTFFPQEFDWSWNGAFLGITVYEPIKSSAQSLPNGNFVICERSKGQISEINKNGQHLWSYKNPTGTVVYNQFDEIINLDNALFRGEKYPSNYPGFLGKDLTPIGLIEDQNSLSESCTDALGNDSFVLDTFYFQNPVQDHVLKLNHLEGIQAITISNIMGQQVFESTIPGKSSIEVFLPTAAVYTVQISTNRGIFTKKIIVL